MSKLFLNHGNFQLGELALAHGTLTIGRSSDNDIRLDDHVASGHHAKIVTLFDACYVQDLGSTNGTFVNGKRIEKHTLKSGDVIHIGGHQLRFHSDAKAARDDSAEHTMMLSQDELQNLLSDEALEHQLQNHSTTAPASAAALKSAAADPTVADFIAKRKAKMTGSQTVHKDSPEQHIGSPSPTNERPPANNPVASTDQTQGQSHSASHVFDQEAHLRQRHDKPSPSATSDSDTDSSLTGIIIIVAMVLLIAFLITLFILI